MLHALSGLALLATTAILAFPSQTVSPFRGPGKVIKTKAKSYPTLLTVVCIMPFSDSEWTTRRRKCRLKVSSDVKENLETLQFLVPCATLALIDSYHLAQMSPSVSLSQKPLVQRQSRGGILWTGDGTIYLAQR